MLLQSSSDTLQVVLEFPVTTNQLQIVCKFRDIPVVHLPLIAEDNRTLTYTNNTTDVNVVSGNATPTRQRLIEYLSINNTDTVDATVIVKYDNEAIEYILYKKSIPPGKSIQYTTSSGFFLTGILEDIDFATETTLALIKAKTDNIDVALSTRTKPADTQKVDGSSVTQPISATSLPLPIGASTESTLSNRLSESDFDTKIGSLTETAPLTDTSSSGLNGRLQKLAQNTTNLLYTLNGTFDAFYRQRFSEPTTIFDSKQLNDNQPLFWDDQIISGSGGASTYNTNQASTTLSVSNNTAVVRARQTFRRFNYQPGKSQMIIQTGIFGLAATGIKRKAGLFNANNGIFFDQQSDGMGVTIRTFTSGSAVGTRVLQSSWNIDKLNGTGTSGVTLDFTKGQVWFMDFEWLGTGDVAFGFFVGRKPIYCHVFNNTNSLNLVWMSTPNLPLRYEIENTGIGAAVGFTHICSTVISEGGIQHTGFPFGVTRTSALSTNNDANIYPLIALRLNSNYLRSTIKLGDFNIICTSTAAYNYYLLLNPTVTGTALSFTAVTNSSLDAQINITNATTVSGGTILHCGVASQTNEAGVSDLLDTDFALGSKIDNTADIVVLAVQRLTGTSETFYASINWRDQQ